MRVIASINKNDIFDSGGSGNPVLHFFRGLFVLLQTLNISLFLLFFWAPFNLPSYLLGVSVGIAFVFVWLIPHQTINFRFLKPYIAFLLSYLLLAISILYSSDPAYATLFVLRQISVLLVPFVFWGMTPHFFSLKRLRFFAFCFIAGCLLLFLAEIIQSAYCFDLLWPYFKIRYVDASVIYKHTGSELLFVLNEFILFKDVYLSWVYLHPIMNVTIEALCFNLAFAFIFIAQVRKDSWLDSRLKKWLANFVLVLFTLALMTAHSKTGKIMFVLSLFLLLLFAFRHRQWKTACGLTSFVLIIGIIGYVYFGMGILGRFTKSMDVAKSLIYNEKILRSDNSLLPRVDGWKTALVMAKEKPVLGFGAGVFKDFRKRAVANYIVPKHLSHPHNHFLYILIANGWIGLCLFLLFLAQAILLLWKNHRLWAWLWFLSVLLLCCTEVLFGFYLILPYCFLMVEYHNRKKITATARELPQ